jgi:predicted Zn-dependent protease
VALAGLAPGFSALGWLDAAVEREDTDPDLFNNRGMLRLRLGDPDGALADLRRASSLDPCTAVYGVNEAGVLWSTRHPAEARARLDALAQTSGPSMVVEVHRALMAYDDGRDAEADATFAAALARWVGAPAILQARAAVRLAQGRAVDALRDAQAALAVDDAAESYGSVVLAAIEAGALATAEEALVALEARSPVSASVDLHRALVASARGRHDAAEQAARRCLARYGRSCVRGMLVLADAARARGDGDCARRYAEAYLGCPRNHGDRRQRAFDARVRERYLP